MAPFGCRRPAFDAFGQPIRETRCVHLSQESPERDLPDARDGCRGSCGLVKLMRRALNHEETSCRGFALSADVIRASPEELAQRRDPLPLCIIEIVERQA